MIEAVETEDLDADLYVLESILWSKTALSARLIDASASRDTGVIDLLRIEAMYQFAEFFFVLKARGIETVERLSLLADMHNAHVSALTLDPDKMRRLGLRSERLLDSIFTSDTMPRLLQTWRERPGTVDQSNLGRLLVTVMSTETCRKLVVASAEAGFLVREKSPYGTVLVRSTGVMEKVFGGVIRDLRRRIQDGQG